MKPLTIIRKNREKKRRKRKKGREKLRENGERVRGEIEREESIDEGSTTLQCGGKRKRS